MVILLFLLNFTISSVFMVRFAKFKIPQKAMKSDLLWLYKGGVVIRGCAKRVKYGNYWG